jgi:hypothetical protein|tara:strand:+ start:25609 stop:26517 length:909 start_codon:yes stop_codon:yes gene_type:complete
MKKFILRLTLFILVLFVSIESYIRFNHLAIDIPERTINEFGIQCYVPNQSGYWTGGTHQWQINSEGWPGEAPKHLSNLITLIGDSHIENFMNEDDCHLGTLLNQSNLKYNFLETGRSGATFIEYLEIAKYLQSKYKTVKQLIFVKESDFAESIAQEGRKNDVVQVDLEKDEIVPGTINSPFLKKAFYSIKTLFFFRSSLMNAGPRMEFSKQKSKQLQENHSAEYCQKLLQFIKSKYKVDNLIFCLHPETSDEIVTLFEQFGLNYYRFKTEDNLKWRNSPDDVDHWNCFGFQQATKQIRTLLQ